MGLGFDKLVGGAKSYVDTQFNNAQHATMSRITDITDSFGKSMGEVAAGSESSGALDHRCKINVKPSDLSKLVANQPQNNGAMASPAAEVVLGPKSDPSNILSPLFETNGLMFPYTPSVEYSHLTTYDPLGFTHSNYTQHSYNKSEISDIVVSGTFTSETDAEARYTIACIHFLRTVTKMYFGNPIQKAGMPPPVLLFNYLGSMFNNVPVVVSSFAPSFGKEVDIVSVGIGDLVFSVPVSISITVTLKVQYNPYAIKNDFNLDTFRTGKLLGKGYI